jgi:hypothetical protein
VWQDPWDFENPGDLSADLKFILCSMLIEHLHPRKETGMNSKFFALLITGGFITSFLLYDSARSDRSDAADTVALLQQKKNKKKKGQGKNKKALQSNRAVQTRPLNADDIKNLVNAAREDGATVLSEGDSYDDFVSVAQSSDGTVYVAYAAYYNGHDQIRLHRQLENGRWSTRTQVPLVQGRADIWMPQLAVDAQDRVWVIWGEQTGQSKGKTGNWDLYARALIGTRWGKIHRLTDNPKPDINPHVTVDSKRNIHVVWQAHPENNGDIQYCKFDGNTWSKPLAVTSDEASDWYPHVAVDQHGKAWVAFDSYRNGDYDVFLTSVDGDELGKVIPIATSTYYEAHASVTCTPDDRVWVAWEQGGHNWGKDQGYWLRRENRNQGTALGSTRRVKVACWQGEKVWAAPDLALSLPQGTRSRPSGSAELATGSDGRLWLRFRHLIQGRQRRPGRFTRGWTENVTYLTKDGWNAVDSMAGSAGRISVFSRILPAVDGSLWIGFSGDARAARNYHRPIQDTALIANVKKPDDDVLIPVLSEYTAPQPPAAIAQWNSSQENRELDAIRSYRVNIDGKPHQIVRGDLHRHTELSWDVGPGNDGSFLDFYRYMIDVAAMDFGGLTDHQGGGHYAYWWWLTEKSCDMYYLAPRFVPLYGYERSATFPNGHRNIFHAYRGVPVFAFQIKMTQSGMFPGVSAGNLVDNDTKLLYEYLHRTDGISMPHTSGTATMGTDWRDNDPYIEPVVEIYQGARNNYETADAPRAYQPDQKKGQGGFQKKGYLWNAYNKGYRLGTIASSDHGSTHISYALVYTPENDRQAIIDSMRKRHTYGSTGNLIIDVQSGDHFMGDEFDSNRKPSLKIRAIGTERIDKVDIIRNNEYVSTQEPKTKKVTLTFTDMSPKEGMNLYYVRFLQQNGEVAWSSPMWVNYSR